MQFALNDALPNMVRLDAHERGQSKLVRLVVSCISSSIKTGSRRIIRLDYLSYVRSSSSLGPGSLAGNRVKKKSANEASRAGSLPLVIFAGYGGRGFRLL